MKNIHILLTAFMLLTAHLAFAEIPVVELELKMPQFLPKAMY
jgi:hypothetical protein